MQVKTKKCKVCNENFTLYKTTQKVCGWKCALKFASDKAKADAEKAHRKKKKQWNEEAMTPSQWKQKLQKTFNKFIRIRDYQKGCVSCETSLIGKKYDAGHFWASTYEGI